MRDDDGLRLNGLARFRKHSSSLALEAYTNCEVPAGCGGVVLRWRRPGAPIGLSFSSHVAAESKVLRLDGQELDEQRTQVAPGEHILSMELGKPGHQGIVLLRVSLEPTIASARKSTLVSKGSENWRATVEEPGDGWSLPGFDDSRFLDMVEANVPQPEGNAKWSWEFLQRDATGMGLPKEAQQVPRQFLSRLFVSQRPKAWVRFTFYVDHEGFK